MFERRKKNPNPFVLIENEQGGRGKQVIATT